MHPASRAFDIGRDAPPLKPAISPILHNLPPLELPQLVYDPPTDSGGEVEDFTLPEPEAVEAVEDDTWSISILGSDRKGIGFDRNLLSSTLQRPTEAENSQGLQKQTVALKLGNDDAEFFSRVSMTPEEEGIKGG